MGITWRDSLFAAVALGGLGTLGAGLLKPSGSPPPLESASVEGELGPVVASVDAAFQRRWTERRIVPVGEAPDLAVMRRLGLALCGTIPSLEEIRRFEARPRPGRLEAWLSELLRDRRCADYLAERFARVFVGTEDGPFLLFRRRRFTTWLSDALVDNRPYSSIVHDLIAETDLWTHHPATNFLTVTFDPDAGRPNPERLGARVARAFLGVRLDCAQCHDHPFQRWKQADFRGLAAFFGGAHSDLRGIRDSENDYRPLDRKTREPVPKAIAPCVPFFSELRPDSGTPRDQLAAWVVNRGNRNFARATVNRVWALLFGRPLAEPIDDLNAAGELHPALLLLADDFAKGGYDLHRLVRIIAATKVFRLDSATDDAPTEKQEDAWAVFPMTRLRAEQVAGALFQSASLATLSSQSHWFARLVVYAGTNDFVRRYGDTGEDEFDARGGTIPQRLLLMNGEIVRQRIKPDFFNASSRIADLAPDDSKAVETVFLAALTRRPTADELSHFKERLAKTSGDTRKECTSDLYWSLLNTTEFSWNH
jgi:hypothetical protein